MTTAIAEPFYPPGPKRSMFGAPQLFEMRRDPTGFLSGLAREHGDIAHFSIGPQHVYLVNHPDYVKDLLVTHNRNFLKGRGLERAKRLLGEGLLTSEGDFHRRQRRLAQPAFHRQRIAAYGDVMVDYAARARDRWGDGETLDVADEMMRLTLGIVGKTLFDADVESDASEVGEAMTALVELFEMLTLPFSELLEKLPLPPTIRFRKARARLDAIVNRIVAERRRSGEDRGDLLSMLLLAQDMEGDGGGMSDEQLRDEAMTIFLAGHETTANALTWTWYLLSRHPEVEAALHAEVDRELEGRRPTAADLPRLRYAEMVFAESMRLYPPAWVVGRRAIDDYEVGGYSVPAGSIVVASQFVMHRDARYFPEPLAFDPERWTPEAKASRPKFSYFPFGAGPRQCIGEGFAWMEGVLLLATIAQRWSLRHVPGHRVDIHPMITLRPRYGMRMTLERRGGSGSVLAA